VSSRQEGPESKFALILPTFDAFLELSVLHGLWGSRWLVGFVALGLVREEHGGAVWEDLGGPAGEVGGGFFALR